MGKMIRKNDIWRLSPLVPLSQRVPADLVTADPRYLNLVATVPEWLFPASVGFAIAIWLLDPWTDDSRLRQFWGGLTRKFVVEGLQAGHWSDWRGGAMPDTDIGVRARIRFTKNLRNGKVWLRVFSCTGRGRKPFEHIIPVTSGDFIQGQVVNIPIVDFGIPSEGWDHTRQRGWGPEPKDTLIGGSGNIVSIECRGWFTQTHRMFIAPVGHVGKHSSPRLYVQDENDDIFDASANCRTGGWRYDHERNGQ